MRTVYKIVNRHMETRGGTVWVPGERKQLKEKVDEKPTLCSGDVFHVYTSPQQAVLFDCIHTGLLNDVRSMLFEATTTKIVVEKKDKAGVFDLALEKSIPVPSIRNKERKAIVNVLLGRTLDHEVVEGNWGELIYRMAGIDVLDHLNQYRVGMVRTIHRDLIDACLFRIDRQLAKIENTFFRWHDQESWTIKRSLATITESLLEETDRDFLDVWKATQT